MTARGLLAIAAVLCHVLYSAALAAQSDAVPPAVTALPSPGPLLSGRTAAVAGVLFAAALIGDRSFRAQAQEYRGATSNSMAGIGNSFGEWRYVLPALSVGYLAGQLAGKRGLKRTILRAGAAAALAGGLSTAVKHTIGRSRPSFHGDPGRFRPFTGWNSFPSGHTAVAFALATSIADDTQDQWSDVALYGAATLTAMARVNDDRHWTSDVLIGGLLGHLSARWLSRRIGPVSVMPGGLQATVEF